LFWGLFMQRQYQSLVRVVWGIYIVTLLNSHLNHHWLLGPFGSAHIVFFVVLTGTTQTHKINYKLNISLRIEKIKITAIWMWNETQRIRIQIVFLAATRRIHKFLTEIRNKTTKKILMVKKLSKHTGALCSLHKTMNAGKKMILCVKIVARGFNIISNCTKYIFLEQAKGLLVPHFWSDICGLPPDLNFYCCNNETALQIKSCW